MALKSWHSDCYSARRPSSLEEKASVKNFVNGQLDQHLGKILIGLYVLVVMLLSASVRADGWLN